MRKILIILALCVGVIYGEKGDGPATSFAESVVPTVEKLLLPIASYLGQKNYTDQRVAQDARSPVTDYRTAQQSGNAGWGSVQQSTFCECIRMFVAQNSHVYSSKTELLDTAVSYCEYDFGPRTACRL